MIYSVGVKMRVFAIDGLFFSTMKFLCGALLVSMVFFTAYTILMRYVFQDPPFWGDTVTMFANVGLVMLAFGISSRENDHIAMQGLYPFLTGKLSWFLDFFWNVCILLFSAFIIYFGYQAAMNVPGQYWELGGLHKTYPMMIMPLAGGLSFISSSIVVIEKLQNFNAVPTIEENLNL